jgi:hypothetical protein
MKHYSAMNTDLVGPQLLKLDRVFLYHLALSNEFVMSNQYPVFRKVYIDGVMKAGSVISIIKHTIQQESFLTIDKRRGA